MYTLQKTLEISAAHFLKLDYPSKCADLHGHNWRVTVHLLARELNANGMIMDFTDIKAKVHGLLDHKTLNDVVDFNPTAENLARYICEALAPYCYRADVCESEGNTASYFTDGAGCPLCGGHA